MAILIAAAQQANQIPLGTTVASYLTEAQFQSINGSSWVLDDGRSIAGSALATLTGITTLADLRGMTIRGKNNGRSDGKQNPDGDSAIGTFQDHAFNSHSHGGATGSHNHGGATGSHTHNVGVIASPTFSGSGGNAVGSGPLGGFNGAYNPSPAQPNTASISSVTVPINPDGGNETRGRNVTLNHFVKINY